MNRVRTARACVRVSLEVSVEVKLDGERLLMGFDLVWFDDEKCEIGSECVVEGKKIRK
jgi:hypothetical protein